MIRKVIGVILLVVGLIGIILGLAGAIVGRDVVDSLAEGLDNALTSALDTLDNVDATLLQTQQTVDSISGTVTTVQTTTTDLATTIDETQPLLVEMAALVSEDVPNAIASVQETIPALTEAARVIDETLQALSRVKIEETIPIINYEISWSLGVDYDPDVPFDQAVADVGDALDPIAESSRDMESDLENASSNMAVLSQDLNDLTENLEEVNESLVGFKPLLDEYSAIVGQIRENLQETQAGMDQQLSTIKLLLTLAMIWFALFQLLPLYVGAELVMGNRLVASPEEAAATS